MKLRTRTLLSVALSLVSLIATLYTVARISMMRSFAALEADDTRQNLARATAVLADDLSTLDHTTSDYAAWDDTCAFLEGRNPNLPTSQFSDQWFPRLRIDFVLIFDPYGRQVFAKAYDPVAGKEREIPQGLRAHLAPGSLLMRHAYPGSKVLGIALLTSGAVLIAFATSPVDLLFLDHRDFRCCICGVRAKAPTRNPISEGGDLRRTTPGIWSTRRNNCWPNRGGPVCLAQWYPLPPERLPQLLPSGLCLNNQQLVDTNLIRKAGASDLDWLDELVD
jgi:hypothetical protein